jgi:hypothetical protein
LFFAYNFEKEKGGWGQVKPSLMEDESGMTDEGESL